MTPVLHAELHKNPRMPPLSREMLDDFGNRNAPQGVYLAGSLAIATAGYSRALRADIFRLGGLAREW
jgi:hypothetical protein